MSDYISRQAAIEAIANEVEPFVIIEPGTTCVIGAGVKEADVFSKLESLPSADVVQVVRCKDCEHYYFADNRIPQEQRYVCEISGEIWKPDSFCSYGERKE